MRQDVASNRTGLFGAAIYADRATGGHTRKLEASNDMDRLGFGVKIPIITLRNRVTAYRLSGLAVYLVGFSGIIVAISYYQLYRYVPVALSYQIPLQLLILGAVLVWLLSGFPTQIRLINDRSWIRFTNLMPVSSWHTLNANFLSVVIVMS